jgi:hypothetical protein
MKTILMGTVGSTAYGLNGPNSDIDTLGIFVYPLESYIGLTDPVESVVTKDPDTTMHEARKYCRLALKCNPTVTELMWLVEYTEITPAGTELIALREKCLSEKAVREAYLGYAKSQLSRLQDRDHKRATKHAMHMARLVNQGYELYTTGHLTIRVDDPDWYVNFKTLEPQEWMDWYTTKEAHFRASECVLPESPDPDSLNYWLQSAILLNQDRVDETDITI